MKEGSVYRTNHCGDIRVLEYIDAKHIYVEFINTGHRKTSQARNIKAGCVRDPLSPSVCGVGFIGDGVYVPSVGGVHTKEYTAWSGILNRCYNTKYLEKKPTYIGCSTSEIWHNLQNFSVWYSSNYVEGYHIDKDLLVIGNKVYSPDTCVFVPVHLNSFLTGSESSRGEYPIGVSYNKRRGKFVSSCRDGSGELQYLGYFDCEMDAHMAWRRFKIKVAIDMKKEMDSIDKRIYPNVLQVINSYDTY